MSYTFITLRIYHDTWYFWRLNTRVAAYNDDLIVDVVIARFIKKVILRFHEKDNICTYLIKIHNVFGMYLVQIRNGLMQRVISLQMEYDNRKEMRNFGITG